MKMTILTGFLLVLGLFQSHAQAQETDTAKFAFADKYYYAVTGERLLLSFLNAEEIAMITEIETKKDALLERFLSHSSFTNIRLANFVSRLSNETAEPYEDVDDYQAAITLTILDGLDFRDIYTKPFYISRRGDSSVVSNNDLRQSVNDGELSNYTSQYQLNFDVSQMNGTVANGYMYDGLFSSQGFGRRFIAGGTNRRPIRGVYDIYLCSKIESYKDASLSDKFVGPDIARRPGDNPHDYQVKCSGCHAVLDSQRGAFAHYHFYDMEMPGLQKLVDIDEERYNRNKQNNPEGDGYETTDDYWENPLVSEEYSKRFGWRTETKGYDALSFSTMIAESEQFQRCITQKLITEFCEKPAENIDLNDGEFKMLYESFRNGGYKVKALVSKIIVSKFCDQ